MKFNEYVEGLPKSDGNLIFFCHNLQAFEFVRSVEADIKDEIEHSLDPLPCRFLKGEEVVYLFYGRPAFKVDDGQKEESSGDAWYPICLVFDAKKLSEPKRVLPFDSGGFVNKRYKKIMYNKMDLEDFTFENGKNSMEIISRMVNFFFGDELSYFDGKIVHRPDSFEKLSELQIKSYLKLVEGSEGEADDRRRTIEAQFENQIILSDALVLIVGPDKIENDEHVIESLKSANPNLDVETYYTVDDSFDPNAYTQPLYEIVRKYLKQKMK